MSNKMNATRSDSKPKPIWRLAQPESSEVARQAVHGLLAKPFEDEEADEDGLNDALDALESVALANQYCFAFEPERPPAKLGSFDLPGGPIFVFTPIEYFERSGFRHDRDCPIGRLLPEDADELRSDGVFQFGDHCGRSLDLTMELLDRGFVWRGDFQAFIERHGNAAEGSGRALLAPILESRGLEAALPQVGSVGSPSL